VTPSSGGRRASGAGTKFRRPPVTGDPARRDVALLFGVNALSAVAGCMLATVVLIERLGTT
jgi:hypothetical protein